MSISIKSAREIELMTEAGRLLQEVHAVLKDSIKVGMTTLELDQICEAAIRERGVVPNFLHYNGYPASVCISINEEVVHGIPSSKRVFKDGDVVGLDTGLIYKGYHSDAARTYILGEGTQEAKDLVRITEECFFEGMKYAKEGNYLFDISSAIGRYAEKHGYGVVRDLCGHGIGTKLHESPEIPNYVQTRKGPKLYAGMTLAIEPMINIGTDEVWWLEDDWTVVTKDGSLSAHYENTVLITKDGPVLLTLTNKE
ncbi:MAG: type I methionyl aminopeptidase [Eubacteriales bacterium]